VAVSQELQHTSGDCGSLNLSELTLLGLYDGGRVVRTKQAQVCSDDSDVKCRGGLETGSGASCNKQALHQTPGQLLSDGCVAAWAGAAWQLATGHSPT
jgi:hypothetical protein